MEKMPESFVIPGNIRSYVESIDGAALVISFCETSGLNGYGSMMMPCVEVKRLTRTCHRCGYDPLWKPNDDDSHCGHHSYDGWRYDTVFAWTDIRNSVSLEEAFERFLQAQPPENRYDLPVVSMFSGRFKWG